MGVMCCLYLFTAVFSPYKIFFLGEAYSTHVSSTLSELIQALYFVDIIVKLNTVIEDREGNLIDDRKTIMRKYFRRAFFLDLI